MKKLLFILPYYKIGGTLTSFVNLIPLIDKKKYNISVYALTNEVDNPVVLPRGVHYLGLKTDNEITESARKNIRIKIINVLKLGKKFLVKLGYDPSDIVFKKMAKPLSEKYDVVIAFQEGQATRMAQYISAPQKIAWVHCIYSHLKNTSNTSAVDVYNSFDKIVCVSQTASKDMINCAPQWKDKIHVVYNALDNAIVHEKAAKGVAFNRSINLVSIGRIAPVKRFSYIPEIASKLKLCGIDFDWWIIGGTAVMEEYDKIMNNINLFNVEDCVHMVGELSNPYPYVKSCNLLVCLSSSETFNYTIAEAKAIGTPIISTDFPCAFEFVEHEKTGLILPLKDIPNGIKRMLRDDGLYNTIKQNLVSSKNEQSVTKEQFELLLKDGEINPVYRRF